LKTPVQAARQANLLTPRPRIQFSSAAPPAVSVRFCPFLIEVEALFSIVLFARVDFISNNSAVNKVPKHPKELTIQKIVVSEQSLSWLFWLLGTFAPANNRGE
jgi:hypothetical protein